METLSTPYQAKLSPTKYLPWEKLMPFLSTGQFQSWLHKSADTTGEQDVLYVIP
jgi:hypothetical protein